MSLKPSPPDNPFVSWINNHKQFDVKAPLAIAVSGGPDSMALAHMALEWALINKNSIYFITVNHGLRESAKDEANMVANWVSAQNSKNIHHVILKWEGEKPDAAIMEMARQNRYELMAEYCKTHNIENLFVAHHQDDQAETFLIRLAKGSGLDGLGGMNDVRDYSETLKIIRPLLDVTKKELVTYCEDHKVPYAQDPSNKDETYLRPRLRQSMDILSSEGLTSKRLALTAKRLNRARQALDDIADSAFQACLLEKSTSSYVFNFSALQGCPEEIALRVVRYAVEGFREDAAYNVRMEKLEDLFGALWQNPESFKPRTLGKCVFSLKNDKRTQNLALYIEREGS